MPMASLSRWTLAFFGSALSCLVIALGLMSLGVGYPHDGLMAPSSLIVVHLIAIGWLSQLMVGAMLQFLPVLVGGQLRGARWAPLALVLIGGGLMLLIGGFGALDGWPLPTELLPLGGLVLIAGFCVAAGILFATLLKAQAMPLPAGFVAVALLAMLVTALLGETLASAIAGLFGGDFAVAIISHGVALHIGFGLGGWLTLAAMGVSYRLVSMFLVAPEQYGFRPRLAFVGALVALVLLSMTLGVLLATNTSLPVVLIAAACAAGVAVAAYLGDIIAYFRARRRRELELHMRAAIAAFLCLSLGGVMLAGAVTAQSEAGLAAAIYVLALGWLGGLGLAMLYKIIAFLTWLECFAPLMGRKPTPRVQDLVRQAHAQVWFALYFGALALGAVALTMEAPLVFQLATGAQGLACLFLIQQFYRVRRLADLPEPWRDQTRPRLFVPQQRSFL